MMGRLVLVWYISLSLPITMLLFIKEIECTQNKKAL